MAETKKLILITGANSGIGLEVARQLLPDTNNHVLLGSRSIEKGEVAISQLRSEHPSGNVELVQVDVSDEKSVAAAARAIDSKHGKLDALVNNAGIAATADGTTADQMVALLKTNAVGAYLMGEYFAPLLKKSAGTPRIINVTSGSGSIGDRLDRSSPFARMKAIPYRVSKSAMNMIGACQWFEFGAEGFKVFIYSPGLTVSNLSPFNKVERGAKPTSEGAAPIIAMLKGEMDEDDGKFIEYGREHFPW